MKVLPFLFSAIEREFDNLKQEDKDALIQAGKFGQIIKEELHNGYDAIIHAAATQLGLIGVGVIAAIYYFYTKMKGNTAAASLGAGSPDNRGVWAADDDALYKKFRAMFKDGDLNWIDPLVKETYENGTAKDQDKVGGIPAKSGSFASVIYGVIPNPKGTYPAVAWAQTDPATGKPMKSIWDPSITDTLFNQFAMLRVKYGGL